MKRTIILAVLAAAFLVLPAIAVEYATKMTNQTAWELLRTEAGEDPNTLVGTASITQATAGDFWSKPTDANGIIDLGTIDGLSSDAYAIEIIAIGGHATDANDKTFTAEIWGWEPENGPAAIICSIAYTTGTQEVVRYPSAMPRAQTAILKGQAAAVTRHWADTAVTETTPKYWYSDMVTVANSGNNGIARVRIMLYGQRYIYAVIKSADGTTGAEATNVSLYYRKISG